VVLVGEGEDQAVDASLLEDRVATQA